MSVRWQSNVVHSVAFVDRYVDRSSHPKTRERPGLTETRAIMSSQYRARYNSNQDGSHAYSYHGQQPGAWASSFQSMGQSCGEYY
jgi:hypothetical protein